MDSALEDITAKVAPQLRLLLEVQREGFVPWELTALLEAHCLLLVHQGGIAGLQAFQLTQGLVRLGTIA